MQIEGLLRTVRNYLVKQSSSLFRKGDIVDIRINIEHRTLCTVLNSKEQCLVGGRTIERGTLSINE